MEKKKKNSEHFFPTLSFSLTFNGTFITSSHRNEDSKEIRKKKKMAFHVINGRPKKITY